MSKKLTRDKCKRYHYHLWHGSDQSGIRFVCSVCGYFWLWSYQEPPH